MIADLLLQTEPELRDTITNTLEDLKIPYLKTENYIVTLLPGVVDKLMWVNGYAVDSSL